MVALAEGASTASAQGFTWSPAWVIESAHQTVLVLTAGADRRLAVDGLNDATLHSVRAWETAGIVVSTPEEHQLLDRLVELGAVVPTVLRPRSISLTGDADRFAGLARHLGDLGVTVEPDDAGAAPETFAVVVRTAPRWPDTPDDAPHLGLDLTLHHTVVLGPLVVPGVSACLGCAATRAAHRWGEPTVAPRPGVVRSSAAVAALLTVQLELAWQGVSPLVNATIAWDLERGTTDRQSLYKMVGCPRCDVVAATGRVALPWAGAGIR